MNKFLVFTAAFIMLAGGSILEAANPIPASENPLEYYAQGGVVTNGIAYFTADPTVNSQKRDSEFVTSFDANTLEKVRRYDFRSTYDSSPYVYQKKDATWVIVCRELDAGGVYRLAARRLDNDALDWRSTANTGSGSIYFGVSTYYRADGSQILYCATSNGLHAISGEDGESLWYIPESSYGGATPCVDQGNAWVYFQADGDIYKIQAETGDVLLQKPVAWPNICSSFNTVLVNDSHGYFVLTRWHTNGSLNTKFDCGIRVWDQDLNLIWEKTGLPYNKKGTITYWDGKMTIGTGNHWGTKYTEAENTPERPWKYIAAYNVADGSTAWFCDLSAQPTYRSIFNAPYFNGYIYAELEISSSDASLLRINASTGELVEVLNYGHRLDSCGVAIIAHGKMISGNLGEGRYIVVTNLAENTSGDWPGLYYDPQTNVCAQPDDPNAVLVPMKRIGKWASGLTVAVAGPGASTSVSPIPFTITFNKPVTYLTAAKIEVTNGTKGELTGSGASYTLLVTPTAPGAVTCKVKDWAVLDPDENGNRASNTASVTFTSTVPTAIVSGPASPTNTSPINFSINFSEPVTGLTVGEITVTNGIKGTLAGSGASYTLPVTPMGQGAVTCQVIAGAAQNGGGIGNAASNTLSIVYDSQSPVATVTGPGSTANTSPISFSIGFNEPVTGLGAAGITVTNGTKGTLTGSGANYTLQVTPTNQGAVTCQVNAGAVQDAAANTNAASNIASVHFDSIAPTATVTGPNSPCQENPMIFTIVFSEPVTGLTIAGIIKTNGTKGTLTGSGAGPYTLPITPAAPGPVTCVVKAGAAQDGAANGNVESNTVSVLYAPPLPAGAQEWSGYGQWGIEKE